MPIIKRLGPLPLLLIILATCTAEQDDGRFPCGDHGGSCDAATELCILGGEDKCSTCVPLPEACDPEASCACLPPGSDPIYGSFACEDAGQCAADGDGLVLTCAEVSWGCG